MLTPTAGSNPNPDVTPISSQNPYGTDYVYETLSPPYMSMPRPTIGKSPSKIGYGASFSLSITLPSGTKSSDVVVNLIEIGYKTHGLAFDQRLVQLVSSVSGNTLTVTGPPSAKIFPPGRAHIFVLAAGVPSVGQAVIVGDGSDPPFSKSAYANMIKVRDLGVSSDAHRQRTARTGVSDRAARSTPRRTIRQRTTTLRRSERGGTIDGRFGHSLFVTPCAYTLFIGSDRTQSHRRRRQRWR